MEVSVEIFHPSVSLGLGADRKALNYYALTLNENLLTAHGGLKAFLELPEGIIS